MSRVAKNIFAGVCVCLIAAVAVMYTAVEPTQAALRADRLVLGMLSAMAMAAVPLIAFHGAVRKPGMLPVLTCALLAAGLGPLMVDGVRYLNRADLSLVFSVLALLALVCGRQLGRAAIPLAVACVGASCYLQLSALMLPLGMLGSAIGREQFSSERPTYSICLQRLRGRVLILLAGLAGALAAWLHGAPLLIHDTWRGLHAVQRLYDLRVLLPLLMLGFLGWQARRPWPPRCGAEAAPRDLHIWAALGLAAIALILCGVPLDARAATLPLLVFAPAGLVELTALGLSSQRPVKFVGLACSGLSVLLCWPGLMRWGAGLLKLVYLLTV